MVSNDLDGLTSLKFSMAHANRHVLQPEQFSCIALNSTGLQLLYVLGLPLVEAKRLPARREIPIIRCRNLFLREPLAFY